MPLFRQKELIEATRFEAQGGRGTLTGRYAIQAGSADEKALFQMVGRMTLQPGDSVGYHCHNSNGEVYCFLNGSGRYSEEGKSWAVAAGDITVTERGQSHGIENTGDEPLVWIAVIAQ